VHAKLENKTIEALRHYREALATIENLEREEACAHRALMIMLTDLDSALLEEGTPSLMRSLFEIGSVAVLRSDEAWTALSEATAKLDLARLTLAALEQQLAYIPGVSLPREIRPSSENILVQTCWLAYLVRSSPRVLPRWSA
jgi:hypothetical protein